MKMILVISVLLLCGYCVHQETEISEDEIYVDKLVYLKKDSTLFTGTLNISNPPHTAKYSFCNGIPCGKWEYRFNGDLIHKGERLDNSILSANTTILIDSEIFYLDYWQEGELSTDPKYLSVKLIKSEEFFKSDKSEYKSYFEQIAKSVALDTKILGYVGLNLDVRQSVYKSEKMFVKEYKIENGKPVDTGIVRE